jgi:acetyl esterase/lipase
LHLHGELPSTLVHMGSWEILRDDSVRLVDRMQKSGVNASLKVWHGMCHSWQLFAPMLDEGMASIGERRAVHQSKTRLIR